MSQPRIGVQLLFGQNPEPFLQAALEAVAWADYVVAVNTAGTHPVARENERVVRATVPDGKLQLAQYPVLRTDRPEPGGLDEPPSFAEARNLALRRVDHGDFVLIVDSDDVHYPEWETIARQHIAEGADIVTATFTHFMVYKDLVQYEAPREILFQHGPGVRFASRVHEQLLHPRRFPAIETLYGYAHYGYIKPQTEVFDRWRLYSALEGHPDYYAGWEGENILIDRLSVCHRFTGQHPPAAREVLERFPSAPPGLIPDEQPGPELGKAPPTVGLILLTYDDSALLDACLETLAATRNDFELLVIDNGSTDDSAEKCRQFQREGTEVTVLVEPGRSLAEALNIGLRHYLPRGHIHYVGWVHPDMEFLDATWLEALRHAMDTHPELAKVCAANINQPIPDRPIDGHEQCYLIRKSVLQTVGLFDESFIGIGGFEDWDLNRRLMNHNHSRVMIWPTAKVRHNAMGTRSRRDTDADARHNAARFHEKWGTYAAPV